MSPTRIEEENNKPNLPLALDSGASAAYLPLALDSGASATRTAPSNRRSQGNSEIWIAEFKNEFEGLVSAGTLVRQDQPSTQHLADQFTTYPRATTHVRPETSRRTRITVADNSIQTVDIRNFYL